MASLTTPATSSQYFSVSATVGPSTMTRHMFCVPEYRTRTRPWSPSSASTCAIAATISGTVAMSGLRCTSTLMSFCGNTSIMAASSESGLPDLSIAASSCSAVRIPSPVVWWSRKIMWPDSSPPMTAPRRCMSSST